MNGLHNLPRNIFSSCLHINHIDYIKTSENALTFGCIYIIIEEKSYKAIYGGQCHAGNFQSENQRFC